MQGDVGGGVEDEVDEQPRVGGAALVLVGLDLARLRLGVELFPLVDVEQQAGGACLVLEPVADELGERSPCLARSSSTPSLIRASFCDAGQRLRAGVEASRSGRAAARLPGRRLTMSQTASLADASSPGAAPGTGRQRRPRTCRCRSGPRRRRGWWPSAGGPWRRARRRSARGRRTGRRPARGTAAGRDRGRGRRERRGDGVDAPGPGRRRSGAAAPRARRGRGAGRPRC